MLKELFISKISCDITSRILSVAMFLTPGLPYSPEHVLDTRQGLKLNVEGKCSLAHNYPILNFQFRDDPFERRGIVLGISDGNTETLGYYAGAPNAPARIGDDLVGEMTDIQNNRIQFEKGQLYQVNIYPATLNVKSSDVTRIPELRTTTEALASKAVTLPNC